ncbi:MAG: porin [Roseovarius sp.]|nr:porin [Roseovarius sp.]
MKRTTLRTSAIALGVAAALPATAQEWSLGWGGMIHQHFAFGSSEVKRSGNPRDFEFDGSAAAGRQPAHIRVRVVDRPVTGGNNVAVPDSGSGNLDLDLTAGRNFYITPTAADGSPYSGTIWDVYNRLFTDDALPTGVNADAYTINIVAPSTAEAPNAQRNRLNAAIADSNYSGNGQHSNTEVHFMPSITLDSGLTFGATIEFEGDKEGVDQSFISVSSDSLGTLKIGKHGKTGLGVGAPSVGIGINSGDHHNFIAVDKGSGAMSGTNTSIIPTNDRISYKTPKNSLGFEFGISYAPGGDDGNRKSGFITSKPSANGANPGDMSDNIDVAFKFEQALGEASFALGMRYGTAKEEGAKKNPRNLGVGAEIGFGGFTFGGAYADVERDSLARSSSGWSLGASYNMEAWTFGIETYQGEADDGDEHSVSKIAASRELGPGVTWDIYAVTASSERSGTSWVVVEPGTANSAEYEDTRRLRLPVTGTSKASGNAFGTAIKLKF